MRYLTAAQMREADRRCIQELGIPGAVLMNNAGAAVFAEIDAGPVGIVCGKGNNGGDGFVVARLALLKGLETRVVQIGELNDLKGDAALFRDVFVRLGGKVVSAIGAEAVRDAMSGLSGCAVLVDALLGTGATGEVRGDIRIAIDQWPAIWTIAVDLPSGMNADTGEVGGNCVRANVTVTFQFPKTGFQRAEAIPYLGRVVVADIGIPEVCADDAAWNALRSRWR